MNELDIRRRIDRRGWGPFFNKLWVAGGLGWMADAMNIAALGLVLPLILSDLGLSRAEGGSIASATFLGFMVGSILTGRLADNLGRRTLLIANIVLFSAAAVGAGFSHSYWALIAMRFVQGVGMGGEFPIIGTYLNELSPRRYRDRLVGLTSAFFAYAFALIPLIGLFVVPALGWRGLFWSLVIPVLFAIWTRRALPESPIFLARMGKFKEAEAALATIEAGTSEKADDAADAATVTQVPKIQKIMSARTALLIPLWLLTFFCQYGFASWTPTAIMQADSNISSSYILTSILFSGMIVGYLAAAFGASKLNPRLFLILSFLEFGLALVLFGLSSNIVFMVIFGWFAAAGYGLTTISAYSYTPAQFATGIRGTGMGLVTGIGRIGAIVGPMIAGWLNPVGGLGSSFIVFGAASMLAVVVIMILERRPVSDRQLNVERA
jgi:putative MFS transporter